ncbi:uncharacterized protein ZK643.5-like [Drosophila obscura]|uniref:uncharacterized protein ZK643.5-like n=1 Tax=Drosophila obscura TaxID=7282 RepID=UPI001BB2821E|nr:uncharacterized protein ZK643.5-like [Drosophila obscura]
MSRRHPKREQEMRDQQVLYTRGHDSLKWEPSRSSSVDCGSNRSRRSTEEGSPERKRRDERRYHRESKPRDRSKERDHHYSRRTKHSRRSDSPVTGDDSQRRPPTNESEQDDPESQSKVAASDSSSAVGDCHNADTDEPFDKERIHRETQQKLEKLRATMSKEVKVHPPAKPESSGSYFANDGSFMDIFKKMQNEQIKITAPHIGASAPPPHFVGRRRGGKILKTGRLPKLKDSTEKNVDPKDFWSVYQAEVNKYQTTGCDKEEGNRKLVK